MAKESKAERCCRICTLYIPVILVLLLIAASYYVYAIQLCICKSSLAALYDDQ